MDTRWARIWKPDDSVPFGRRAKARITFSDAYLGGFFITVLQSVCSHGHVKTTPRMTRFRDAKVSNNLVSDEIDDHRIQSDYKCTIGLQNQGRKELYTWYCVCVVKPSDKTHDTNDNVTTKTQSTFHTAHMNLNT